MVEQKDIATAEASGCTDDRDCKFRQCFEVYARTCRLDFSEEPPEPHEDGGG